MAALDAALQAGSFLLFKRSRADRAGAAAWKEYVAFTEEHDDLPTGWVDVEADPDLAKRVADRTGVPHESPQALWIRKGRVGWHASNDDVSVEAFTRALIALPQEKKGA